jgi:hypothetical protein
MLAARLNFNRNRHRKSKHLEDLVWLPGRCGLQTVIGSVCVRQTSTRSQPERGIESKGSRKSLYRYCPQDRLRRANAQRRYRSPPLASNRSTYSRRLLHDWAPPTPHLPRQHRYLSRIDRAQFLAPPVPPTPVFGLKIKSNSSTGSLSAQS